MCHYYFVRSTVIFVSVSVDEIQTDVVVFISSPIALVFVFLVGRERLVRELSGHRQPRHVGLAAQLPQADGQPRVRGHGASRDLARAEGGKDRASKSG